MVQTYRPLAEKIDEEVASEFGGHHLRDDVQIADQSGLKDDGNIAGVEQLDRIAAVLTTITGRLDWQIHAETLKTTSVEKF